MTVPLNLLNLYIHLLSTNPIVKDPNFMTSCSFVTTESFESVYLCTQARIVWKIKESYAGLKS